MSHNFSRRLQASNNSPFTSCSEDYGDHKVPEEECMLAWIGLGWLGIVNDTTKRCSRRAIGEVYVRFRARLGMVK